MKRFGYFILEAARIHADPDDPVNWMTRMRWEETRWGTPPLRTLAPVKRCCPCGKCLSDD